MQSRVAVSMGVPMISARVMFAFSYNEEGMSNIAADEMLIVAAALCKVVEAAEKYRHLSITEFAEPSKFKGPKQVFYANVALKELETALKGCGV